MIVETGRPHIARFCAISAAFHLAAGSVALGLVRLGEATPAPVDAVIDVALVVAEVAVQEPAAVTPGAPPTIAPATGARDAVASEPEVAPATETPPESAPAIDGWSLGELPAVRPIVGDARPGDAVLALVPSQVGGSGSDAVARGASVRAWLEQHKRYPRAAAQRRIEGEVVLDLRLDALGAVESARVSRSSGHRVLDDEVLRMVERATPFPADVSTRTGVASYRIVIEFYLEDR